MPPSFVHVLNPFVCPPDSEHGIASRVTWASLGQAITRAHAHGLDVAVNAVVKPGDEAAVLPPARLAAHLDRTVQDVRPLRPVRPLPLIGDILQAGTAGSDASHVIFTNMDIAVQPDFYVRLAELIEQRFDAATPFVVYWRNIPAHYTDPAQLPAMYAEPGERAYGFDCFVFPRPLLAALDLGASCIGAAHFDYLMFMALDAASGFRIRRVDDLPLTFHLGNDIAWSGQIDYIEHNLGEALSAIARMRARFAVPDDSQFARLERGHFRPNARFDSVMMRKLKRLPGVASASVHAKRWLGRSH